MYHSAQLQLGHTFASRLSFLMPCLCVFVGCKQSGGSRDNQLKGVCVCGPPVPCNQGCIRTADNHRRRGVTPAGLPPFPLDPALSGRKNEIYQRKN